MKLAHTLIIATLIAVLVVASLGVLLYYQYFNRPGGSRYETHDIPDYLITPSELTNDYKMTLLESEAFVYYSTTLNTYVCYDSGQPAEKFIYNSFSGGPNVVGSWGSTSAYICGDLYIIVRSNDANPWTAYGLFKKNQGFYGHRINQTQ
jgi:hypothetical protein